MSYDKLPPVPAFTVTSTDVASGERFPAEHHSGVFGVPGGKDTSPQLAWPDAPAAAQSFVVTMWDRDAPIPSGFWHWGLVDIPGSVRELASGAGAPDANLPGAAFQLKNDATMAQYMGAAPPTGTGKHEYFVVVHALDIASVKEAGVTEDSSVAALHFLILQHTLGRGILTAWANADA